MLTLSQKEKMLLQDQKTHEQICIEKYTKYASQATDSQLKQIFNTNADAERTHLNSINQLLNGTVPQMNQQQSQGSQQNQGSQQSFQSQGSNQNTSNSQTNGAQFTDADMCTDLLMTEKYVSGAYDTAIFEFRDPQVREVLNHIQKEEQQHGEAIFKYMESKGMYKVQ
jgi:spore coat protein CotF